MCLIIRTTTATTIATIIIATDIGSFFSLFTSLVHLMCSAVAFNRKKNDFAWVYFAFCSCGCAAFFFLVDFLFSFRYFTRLLCIKYEFKLLLLLPYFALEIRMAIFSVVWFFNFLFLMLVCLNFSCFFSLLH